MEVAFLVLLFFSSLCQAAIPEVRGDVAQKGLTYATEKLVPLLQSNIASIKIPDISGKADSFEYKVSNFKINQVDVGSVNLSLLPGTGLHLSVSNFHISISADWSFREQHIHFPSGSGSLSATVSDNSGIDADLALIAKDGHPFLHANSIKTRIDGLDVKISGSIIAPVVNLIVGLFKSQIKGEVEGMINSEVASAIDDTVNPILATLPTVVTLPIPAPFNDISVDWTVIDLDTTAATIGAGLKGLISVTGAADYPGQQVPLAPASPDTLASFMASLSLSPYVVNSGLWAVTQQGLLDITISDSDIPSSFPITDPLNTTYFAVIVPLLALKYPSHEMTVEVKASEAPVVSINSSQAPSTTVDVTGTAEFSFNVVVDANTTQNAFVLTCPLHLKANASVFQETLYGELSLVSCELEKKSSNFGPVNTATLKFLVDKLLTTILVPMVNHKIESGFPIPSVEGVSLQDTIVATTENSTLEIHTNVNYQMPQAVAAACETRHAYRQARAQNALLTARSHGLKIERGEWAETQPAIWESRGAPVPNALTPISLN